MITRNKKGQKTRQFSDLLAIQISKFNFKSVQSYEKKTYSVSTIMYSWKEKVV